MAGKGAFVNQPEYTATDISKVKISIPKLNPFQLELSEKYESHAFIKIENTRTSEVFYRALPEGGSISVSTKDGKSAGINASYVMDGHIGAMRAVNLSLTTDKSNVSGIIKVSEKLVSTDDFNVTFIGMMKASKTEMPYAIIETPRSMEGNYRWQLSPGESTPDGKMTLVRAFYSHDSKTRLAEFLANGETYYLEAGSPLPWNQRDKFLDLTIPLESKTQYSAIVAVVDGQNYVQAIGKITEGEPLNLKVMNQSLSIAVARVIPSMGSADYAQFKTLIGRGPNIAKNLATGETYSPDGATNGLQLVLVDTAERGYVGSTQLPPPREGMTIDELIKETRKQLPKPRRISK